MSTLTDAASYIPPLTLTATGVGTTIRGALRFGDGEFVQGATETLFGLTLTNFGAQFSDLGDRMPQELMKYSICEGSIFVALKGLSRIKSGLSERNLVQIFKGAVQSGMGIAGAIFIEATNSKTLLVAQQTLFLTFVSSYISKTGLSNLAQGKYKIAACKLLLGVGGLACAGYYLCNELFDASFDPNICGSHHPNQTNPTPYSLSPEERVFLTQNKAKIEYMAKTNQTLPGWEIKGQGFSKRIYQHSNLPESLVKISTETWRGNTYRNDAETHYMHLQEAQKKVHDLQFQHIVVPTSHLMVTKSGQPFVVEQKLDLVPFSTVPNGPCKDAAREEFRALKKEIDLCDVYLERNHNVGVIKGTEHNPQIGIYDFDCKGDGAQAFWGSTQPALPSFHQDYQALATSKLAIGGAFAATLQQAAGALAGSKAAKIVMAAAAAGAVVFGSSVGIHCSDLASGMVCHEAIMIRAAGGSIIGAVVGGLSVIGWSVISKGYSCAMGILSKRTKQLQ